MWTRRQLLTSSAAALAISTTGLASEAIAQIGGRTVRILTGYTPGVVDAIGRLVAAKMQDYAETIIVETRPGAAGRLAAEAVKAADPDGTTILLAPLGFIALFPHIYRSLRYQTLDFIAVSTVASSPTILTIGPKVSVDVTTLADFIAWCRAHSGQATYGSAGVGTTLHFTGTMLGRMAGFPFLHVPYQGRTAVQDLLKGEIACTFLPIDSTLGLVQSGNLRALATTGPRRSAFLPDVPTMAEAGYPALEDLTRYGLFVAAGTPIGIVERLNRVLQSALARDEIKSGLAKLALEIDSVALADFSRLIASESERWASVVSVTGFTPLD
jgi:tripartite-type tricarboxylate transporter receptor subunit TctC